jgi:U1 small nuclear ribonucleoprotein
MPGTHLLPPNLLKLFAPRPPLHYLRPAGKDIDRVTNKSVSGVGRLLEQLRETTTAGMLSSGEAPDTENGEDTSLTHAEETMRQIRREERKRRREELFKIARDTCNFITFFLSFVKLTLFLPRRQAF